MRKELGQVLAERDWPAVELPMTNGLIASKVPADGVVGVIAGHLAAGM